jgi:hypothetical protein
MISLNKTPALKLAPCHAPSLRQCYSEGFILDLRAKFNTYAHAESPLKNEGF